MGVTANFIAKMLPSTPVFVGSFSDSDPTAVAADFTAAINWGNNNNSAGTVTASSSTPGLFLITGTNLYNVATIYNVSILVQDNVGDSTTISSLAAVTNGPVLTPIPTTANFTQNMQPSSRVTIGFLYDSTPNISASDLTASIDWGNGNNSAGTLTPVPTTPGLFSISGTNLYTVATNYNITIAVQDNLGDSTTVNSTAVVTDGPVLTPIPATVSFTAGAQPSTPVAVGSFYDKTPGAQASDFTASINWGTGQQSSPGIVTASLTTAGLFVVSGTYLYATPGTDNISIQVHDNLGDSTTIASTADVTNTPVLTPNPPITASFTVDSLPTSPVTLGSFFDSNTSAVESDFTATINWGNGNTSVGTITAAPGTSGLFSISGVNLYTVATNYDISILVQDNVGDSTTVRAVADVTTGPVLTPIPVTASFTKGMLPSSPVTVGFVYDSSPDVQASDLTATISWGNGNTSVGTVTASSTIPGLFAIAGTNLYDVATDDTISILVQDNLGDSTTINSIADVTSGPILTPLPATVNFTAGVQPASPVTVGSFYDSNSNAQASDFTATINWGAGQQSTAGTVTASATIPGLFMVSGTYLYAAPGTYNVSIQVHDNLGDSIVINSTAVVTTGLTAIPATIYLTAGVPPSSPVTVGSFYDSASGAQASDFTATIDWGNGQNSPGTVTASSTTPGLFLITASYIYPAPGNYTVSITIQSDLTNSINAMNSNAIVVLNVVATSANFGFTGALDPNTDNGPYASTGYTNTNRPTFSGTAVPFSTVELYGKYWGADAVEPLGETVANAAGQWILPTGPLTPGTYTITATVTPPGSYPSSANTFANNGLVYIDMAPPKVKVAHHKTAKPTEPHSVARRNVPLSHHKPDLRRRPHHPS